MHHGRAFQFGQRIDVPSPARMVGASGTIGPQRWEMAHTQNVGAAYAQQRMETIPQLLAVAVPGTFYQVLHQLWVQCRYRFVAGRTHLVKDVRYQPRDVLLPFPQRWNANGHHSSADNRGPPEGRLAQRSLRSHAA